MQISHFVGHRENRVWLAARLNTYLYCTYVFGHRHPIFLLHCPRDLGSESCSQYSGAREDFKGNPCALSSFPPGYNVMGYIINRLIGISWKESVCQGVRAALLSPGFSHFEKTAQPLQNSAPPAQPLQNSLETLLWHGQYRIPLIQTLQSMEFADTPEGPCTLSPHSLSIS